MNHMQTIKESGLRFTAARVKVLTAVSESDRALSHLELSQQLKSAGLDRVTVYRNLNALHRAGVLEPVELGDRVWRFSSAKAQAKHRHPHFVCTQCQEMTCLKDVVLAKENGD